MPHPLSQHQEEGHRWRVGWTEGLWFCEEAAGRFHSEDWTVRIIDGLELDIEEAGERRQRRAPMNLVWCQEPDLYIPTMGFVTYVAASAGVA